MYLKINKFLLAHEFLNMSKVPGFYQFFYSSDFEVTRPESARPRSPRSWATQPSSRWLQGF